MTAVTTKVVLRRSLFAGLMGCAQYENDDSEPASFGRLVHAAIAEWISTGDVTWETLIDGGVAASDIETAVQLVARFMETHDREVLSQGQCEVTLRWETPDALLTGTPDHLQYISDRHILISDWKSGWAASVATDRYQGMWYGALACLNDSAVETVTVRFDYLRLSEENGVNEWTERRDTLLRWFEDNVVANVPLVLARADAEPTGGSSCTYCRKRWDCAASVAPYRNEPRTIEEVQTMIGELVRLEAAADERKKALQQWFREREPIVVNGLECGYLRPRDGSFRISDIEVAMATLGDEARPLLRFDSARLKAGAKKALIAAGAAAMVDGEPAFKTRAAS
jgi:hypothetical protein